MADSPVERIYAEVGFESTVESDLESIAASLTATDEAITKFSTSFTSSSYKMSTDFSTSASKIKSSVNTITAGFSEIAADAAKTATDVEGANTRIAISYEELAKSFAAYRGMRDLGTAGFLTVEEVARLEEVSNLMRNLQGVNEQTAYSYENLAKAFESFRNAKVLGTSGFLSAEEVTRLKEVSVLMDQTAASNKKAAMSYEELAAAFASYRSIRDLGSSGFVRGEEITQLKEAARIMTDFSAIAADVSMSNEQLMQSFSAYRNIKDLGGGAFYTKEYADQMREVARLMGIEVPGAFKEAEDAVVGSTARMGQAFQRIHPFMTLFAAELLTIPARIIGAFEKIGVESAAQFEVVQLQLERFYGGIEEATERFQKFSTIAAKTPFQFDEIMQSVLMMKDIGINADAYINTLLDTSSAMNRSLEQTTRTFVAAIGGRFQMLRNYGIYAYQVTKANMDEFSKLAGKEAEYGETALLYYDKMGQRKVEIVSKYDKEVVASTLTAIWNEKFAGAMEDFSQTLIGLWSTVQDTFKYFAAEVMGYSMDDAKIRTVSFINVLKLLEKGLIATFGFLSSLPAPFQTFIAAVITGVGAVSLFVAGLVALRALTATVTWGLGSVAASFLGITISAQAGTVAVAGLGVTLTFVEAITGVLVLVGAVAALVAVIGYLQDEYGILDPAIRAFNNIITIAGHDVPILAREFSEWASSGISSVIEKFESLNKMIDEFGDKHPLLKGVLDTFIEIVKFSTGISQIELIDKGIKYLADSTDERAKEISAIKHGMAGDDKDLADQSTQAYDQILGSFNFMGEGIGDTTDGIMGSYDSLAGSAEDSAKRQQKAFEETFEKYNEEVGNIKRLNESGFLTEDNPYAERDLRKLTQIEDKIPDITERIDSTSQRIDELNSKYADVKSKNERTLSKLQDDIEKQVAEYEKLVNAGVDNNPEIIKMEKQLTVEKQKLSDLYTDSQLISEKEKLAELYTDTSIAKEKKKLQELFSDDSIIEARERLAELYSTDKINDEIKKLQKIYSDDSIIKEKQKLTEMFSTEDIDREKKKLVELFNDKSVQEAREKLFEIQSSTAVEDEKKKLLDLQNDLKNNKEFALESKQTIQEELNSLQALYAQLSGPQTTTPDLELATDPIIAQMLALRNISGGESDTEGIKETIAGKINELKLELVKLSPNSNDYVQELTAQLEDARKQAEELKTKAESEPSSENVNALMNVQARILDLEKSIVDAKNNPNIDIVTDLENQIKAQQDKITQMEDEKQKEIQDQTERIAELEKERAENIAEQEKRIADVTREHQKAITEQQQKIAQMEQDRAEQIQEQQERISEMEKQRQKDINEQQKKIAQMERDRAEAIAEQQDKIAKMEQDRQKNIADQQAKIAKMEKELADKKQEQQDKIAELENNIVKKKEELQEKINEAYEKLNEARTQFLDTSFDQAKNLTDLQNQITEQNKNIMKLRGELDALKTDKAIYEAKLGQDFRTDQGTVNELLSGKGIELKPQAGLPPGTTHILQMDPRTGEIVLQYMDAIMHKPVSKYLSELDFPDGKILEGVHKNYILIDNAVVHNSEDVIKLKQDAEEYGYGTIGINNKVLDSYDAHRKEIEDIIQKNRLWKYTVEDSTKVSFAPLAQNFEYTKNKIGETTIVAQNLNGWLAEADNISYADALLELERLRDNGRITTDQFDVMYAYLSRIDGMPMEDVNGQIHNTSDYLTDANIQAIATSQGLNDVNKVKLTQAMNEVDGARIGVEGLGTAATNSTVAISSPNDVKYDSLNSEISTTTTGLNNTSESAVATATRLDWINGVDLSTITNWINLLLFGQTENQKESGLVIAGFGGINKQTLEGVYGWVTSLTGGVGDTIKNSGFLNTILGKTDQQSMGNVTGQVNTLGNSSTVSKGKSDGLFSSLFNINGITFPSVSRGLESLGTYVDGLKRKISELVTTAQGIGSSIKTQIENQISSAEAYVNQKYNQYIGGSSSNRTSTYTPNTFGGISSPTYNNNNSLASINNYNLKIGTQINSGAMLQTQKVQSIYWG
jgi:hypothetical protein